MTDLCRQGTKIKMLSLCKKQSKNIFDDQWLNIQFFVIVTMRDKFTRKMIGEDLQNVFVRQLECKNYLRKGEREGKMREN